MKKIHKLLILFTLIFIFLLVFKPHLSYPMPFHVDEWHHITESIRMDNYGEYFQLMRDYASKRFNGLEFGFHLFLFLISWVFDLVLIYQFLPALWAVFSASTLFYVVYKKTNNNFWISWLSMIFFASIRSNVNITGLWFFTPLTFVIPFIFLYIYFFTEGIEKQNKKYILYSLAIIILLIPTHSISFLFAVPALIIYSLIHYKYLLKEYKFFSSLLLIPLAGILFFKYALNIRWSRLINEILHSIQFRYGWSPLEIHNSLTEVYHWIGYFLAIIGIIFVIYLKKYKKYIFYILWPITTFLLVIIYKLTGISYLSPYQRNLYYFALGLPIFSAIGLYSIIKITQNKIYQLIIEEKELIILKKFSTLKVNFKINKKYVKFTHFAITGIITFIILATVGTLSFFNYYNLPFEVHLYQVINKKEYGALNFLKSFPRTRVMATPFVSTALYPITGHDPIGTLTYFGYGDRQIIELFFTRDCNVKKEIIKSYEIGYVISPILLECDNLELIYNQENNFIYKTN